MEKLLGEDRHLFAKTLAKASIYLFMCMEFLRDEINKRAAGGSDRSLRMLRVYAGRTAFPDGFYRTKYRLSPSTAFSGQVCP